MRGQSGHNARGHAVVFGEHCVNLVAGRGQALLHVLLGIVRLPAVGEGFADVLDLAAVEAFLQNFHHALEQERGVRIALVALDEGVVAFRLRLLDFLGDDAAHADVVERDVECVRILELHVIGNRLDAGIAQRLDRRQDGVRVESHNENHIRLLRDQAFDVGGLLLGGALCVGRNVGVASRFNGRLDGGFVGLPAFFLESLPRHSDGFASGERRHRRHAEHQRASRHSQKLTIHSRVLLQATLAPVGRLPEPAL